ncbi:hypothetical protein GF362_03765 [Candidatus Dojkabacteria bacterium]|nr:hypothetical protein [Candidatus Dojkabacteria bacterium]
MESELNYPVFNFGMEQPLKATNMALAGYDWVKDNYPGCEWLFDINRIPVLFTRWGERDFRMVASEKEPEIVTGYRRIDGIMQPVQTIANVGDYVYGSIDIMAKLLDPDPDSGGVEIIDIGNFSYHY